MCTRYVEGCDEIKVNPAPKLSKSQKKKLKKLEEEKEKALLLSKSLETLQKYTIPDGAYTLLKSSRNIGQAETFKKKRRMVVEVSKAGFEVPYSVQPIRRDDDNVSSESEPELDETHSNQEFSRSEMQPAVVEKGLQTNINVSLSSPQHPVDNDEPGLSNEPAAAAADCGKSASLMVDLAQGRSMESTKVGPSNTKPTVVHVSRPDEVEQKRKDLPIVMMEQEIMEAINDHLTVIICGETGCGKTTQVPQFLYEAGFGSKQYVAHGGTIGVTQPRRVAVLATAKRVAYELGLSLGKQVGFQVRYDKKIGHNCSIKFMTDGILLRELQNDFLLRHYSVIVLDEAHERSLNTDILIGMLSRVIQGREKIYAQQQKLMLSGQTISPENQVFPLKVVLMSATLRVEDFISGNRLFCVPPPVIEVPTRQFPVTTHFSKRTEIVDYIGQAYKKVLAIHKSLPQGGILVFVTGQREVEYLCQKLRRASKELIMKASKENVEPGLADTEIKYIGGISMEEINDAFDTRGNSTQEQTEMFSLNDGDQCNMDEDELDFSYESETDSDLEFDGENVNSLGEKLSETDSTLVDVLGENGNLDSLKAAFEALAGKTASNTKSNGQKPESVTQEACLEQSNPNKVNTNGAGNGFCVGGLHVLPLYAMLPAAAQLCVFEDVKEGERLVVVATNVAETSLTIPGIKYVVDTGREKVKNYNSSSGMESYEVQWISKASAAQRAGRAGRTAPGHCYRLYSSAVFNNIFHEFSLAEILKIPVDGVVLLMKSMRIDKVANFPFPTPPEKSALVEAERCLKVLEALDSDGKLTALGRAMARYPMSPRHSRMLLTVIQIIKKKKSDSRPNLILAYAVAAAAALSLSNPFVLQFEESRTNKSDLEQEPSFDASENNKVIDNKQEKSRKKKLKETCKLSREKFSNPSSDAMSVAYALQCFELAESPTEFCDDYCLHLKTMEEMSKLRKQLLRLVFNHSGDSDLEKDFSWMYGTLEDVEQSWGQSYNKHPLSLYEEELLGQAICAGWADRVAKRLRLSSKSLEGEERIRANRYQSCMVKESVFLHRWSTVTNSAPEFVVYSELLQTKRPYMHGVTRVKSEWLVEYARSQCTFSTPSADTKPYYEPRTDQVLHYLIPTFGPHLWVLSPFSSPITDSNQRFLVFAYALLEGQVLPCLKYVRKFMAAPPSSILRPEASGQTRVGNLITKLKKRFIDSCAMLSKVWIENPRELHSEIMDWFQDGFRDNFEGLWSQMLSEVVLEAQERFPTKKSKKAKLLK
ncbi:ATP-dependent RNA helicase DEAH13 isoform X2 [Humulus lupulus]|uniref:ATP-dependent RNA helicase DEAH13 isoform X2 n=1 Tax=Humulus lupulus TaxID=3486 RepID=UPI002B406EE9|nr:ATP-dependent RNA helicase DEAH13 isoform X2 [Humulus lupulus]XP_062083221.1 ATP-dependent RNA helicase DEAH13 isoform X2 [Humulus lupulus]XP_062083225.1 ATP-dependent RNA helicase DEAH13 isoform X2 [Humulus lupulus]